MKFSIKDFFSKCDQIRKELQIWPGLLKKTLMKTSFLVQYSSDKSQQLTTIVLGTVKI